MYLCTVILASSECYAFGSLNPISIILWDGVPLTYGYHAADPAPTLCDPKQRHGEDAGLRTLIASLVIRRSLAASPCLDERSEAISTERSHQPVWENRCPRKKQDVLGKALPLPLRAWAAKRTKPSRGGVRIASTPPPTLVRFAAQALKGRGEYPSLRPHRFHSTRVGRPGRWSTRNDRAGWLSQVADRPTDIASRGDQPLPAGGRMSARTHTRRRECCLAPITPANPPARPTLGRPCRPGGPLSGRSYSPASRAGSSGAV
jgi:hypothetical protein